MAQSDIKVIASAPSTRASQFVILIRILVGWVFVSEGIQKFLFQSELGVGRFARIGIPLPEVMAPFVGAVEIVGGALILIGLASRAASFPLLISMLVAITTTKIPLLLHDGFWKMAHEARVDFSMLFGLLFLLFVNSGSYSVDSWYLQRRTKSRAP
jgi:putative oxidoreductase